MKVADEAPSSTATSPTDSDGWAVPPLPGTTKSVMLCAASVVERAPPDTATSPRRVIVFAAVSCHAWAEAPGVKFARLRFTSAALATLLIAITVRAPSALRWAAKTARLSGFGPVARTLTSPKADLRPS